MPRTALIAGATGLVGDALLERLLADSRYSKVTVLARKTPHRIHPKLQVVKTDFTGLAALGGALLADDVYCCLGTTLRKAGSRAAFEKVDYHMVVDLARAAKRAGSTHFVVVSSIGASARSPVFYSRVKGRMEQTLADIGFKSLQIIRPSLLLGTRAERRAGEQLAQWVAPVFNLALRGPLRSYRAVGADEVADAMVEAAIAAKPGIHRHSLPR